MLCLSLMQVSRHFNCVHFLSHQASRPGPLTVCKEQGMAEILEYKQPERSAPKDQG